MYQRGRMERDRGKEKRGKVRNIQTRSKERRRLIRKSHDVQQEKDEKLLTGQPTKLLSWWTIGVRECSL